MNQQRTFRIRLENIIILLLAVFSFFLFILTFFPFSKISQTMQGSFEMGRMVQRAFSIVLFVLSLQLWKRKRNAWNIAMGIFILNFLRGLIGMGHPFHNGIMLMDLFLFLLFFSFRKDFCCPAGRENRSQTLLLAILAIAGVLLNVGITWHYMRLGAADGTSVSFADSFVQGISMIFGMGTLPTSMADRHGTEFVLFWFSWCCILAAILCALRPWLQKQAHGAQEIQHARTLLNLYSQNPCSYLALEDDKCLYFGHSVDGVIPYGTVGSTIVVNGDPVCRDEDFPALLEEFKEFCQNSAHDLFFLGLTDYYLSEYEKQGFGLVKSGEEARFKLSEYEISGKKGAKMRMNINHATKAGVTVHEYKVLEQRDPAMDREFDRITAEWLEGKKSGMLQFTMGTVGLENPMDKRYFYALNSDGKMVAFIVFVPFLGKNGYMADVTRHGKDAPSGVMETIIYEAFQVFKEEGIGYGSLGVAPLAGLNAESSNPMERLLQFIYDHLNACYGFRDLFRAKEKYSPTEWVPSYYAYLPKYPTPGMLYAAVEIQNPHGIRGYILTLLKGGVPPVEKVICKHGIADTPEARIYYKDSGQGIPLLMLHGNAETHLVFEYYEKRLSREYRTILMDSRAHGRSKLKSHCADKEFTITDMAKDVAALLDALHIPSCILVGFSDGANIALEFASLFPGRTRAVIAVSGNITPDGLILPVQLFCAWKYRFFKAASTAIKKHPGRLYSFLFRQQQLSSLLCNAPMIAKEQLQAIQAPVLLIAGTKDLVKVSHSRLMSRLIPRAQLLLMKGDTHTSMFVRKEFYLKAIHEFLDTI